MIALIKLMMINAQLKKEIKNKKDILTKEQLNLMFEKQKLELTINRYLGR